MSLFDGAKSEPNRVDSMTREYRSGEMMTELRNPNQPQLRTPSARESNRARKSGALPVASFPQFD
jgi:hypothetical protein